MSEAKAGSGGPGEDERRSNHELRERLDQIIDLARQLSQGGPEMSQEQLETARLRIEWLAEEIWAAAVYGSLEERTRPES